MAQSTCCSRCIVALGALAALCILLMPLEHPEPPPSPPPSPFARVATAQPLAFPPPPPPPLPRISSARRLVSAPQVGAPQVDLVFGVVAFPPADKAKAAASFRAPYLKGVRRWVRSVRQATTAAQTQLLLFTSEGAGALTADAAMARWLAEQRVAVEYGDFADAPSRVAHGAPEKFIWCVMRNRWFVIADYLERHAGRFRYVLMTDVRDVVLQADPFAAALAKNLVDGAQSTVVFSGEGAGRVKQLRDSKKGKPRTLDCAGPAPLRAPERQKLLATEPLNAGVTLGGAAAFRNFSRAMAAVIQRTTSAACVGIKDCTDQGLYNLLVYQYWGEYLPHAKRVLLPTERALSYTLGHVTPCCRVAPDGTVLAKSGEAPPILHQFTKAEAGRKLLSDARFRKRYIGRGEPSDEKYKI